MTDVQRFRQSGYDNSLIPSSNDNEAFYMFYRDHTVVVSLLREQLAKSDGQLALVIEQNNRLMSVIDKLLEDMRSR